MSNDMRVVQERDIQGIISIRVVERVGSSGVYYEVYTQIIDLGTAPTIVQKATLEDAIKHSNNVYNTFVRLYQQIDDITAADTHGKFNMFSTSSRAVGKAYQGLGSASQGERGGESTCVDTYTH